MSGVNSCNFVGNLTRDVELRYTSGGKAVADIGMAASTGFGEYKYTEFIKAVVWGKTAEACDKYLSKGDMIYLSGDMRTEKWTDRDGNDRYTTKIHARDVQFLKTKGKSGQQELPKEEDEDSVPF